METKLSKWNVIWIFHIFIMKSSEGLVSTKGELIFRPAAVVAVGTNLTIICVNKLQTCPGNMKFLFEINGKNRIPDFQNQTTSMIEIVRIRTGYHVVCYMECHGLLHVINMTQLEVGYPPDRPTNVKCQLEEFSTEVKCEWDTGQITGLPTHYKVHRKNLQTGEDAAVSTHEAVASFPVDMTQDVTHQIQIFAVNQLNQSESDAVQFQLDHIVVPLTPVIKKINISDTSLIIHITWRNQTSENRRSCEVEYKTLKQPSWTLAGEEVNTNNMVSLKKIRHADSLRVRCREEFGKSYWSRWSAPYQMPPSAPEEFPNVWRLLGRRLPDGAQEVVILTASDPDDSPRINVSGYEVYYYNQGVRTFLKRCPPSGVQCAALIPQGVRMVTIAAYNPYGFSPAIDLPIQEEDASGPQQVTLKSLPPTSMSVQWQPPRSSSEPIRWFLLQWTPESCDGKHRNISWQKIGKEQTNFTIKDNVAPGCRVTISVYAVYSTTVSKPHVVYGYTQEFEPRTGPSSIKIVKPSMNARDIEWSEIPLCDRRGFITGYTVHIRQYRNESHFSYEVPASTRHLRFNIFNPDEQYSVCISASTRAGEGPADHCTNFHEDNDFHSYLGLLVGTAFGVFVLSAIILILSRIRKRVKKGLILLLPKCLHEEYPHVGRSSAVKSLQANKESPEPRLNLLPTDPEIVEIEEMPSEVISSPITSAAPPRETNSTMELEESPLIPNTDVEVSEHAPGYRPQTANITSHHRDSYCGPTHMLDVQRSTLGSGSPLIPTNINFLLNFKDLMVTAEPLWPTTDPTSQSLWDNQTFIEGLIIPDVPGDPVMDTPSVLEEFDDTKSYFPQVFTGGL
ncbi:interleukin-23 receptor [Bufo gargarizans]|uniref:interleukin-23 receptor n=1 Tax=Bufo gargarizans TaxID=30331 RepID=UPI001CF1D28D|nr:interleukin-23 receptor [Bufo gargarizans]